jgi:hypothetical protein
MSQSAAFASSRAGPSWPAPGNGPDTSHIHCLTKARIDLRRRGQVAADSQTEATRGRCEPGVRPASEITSEHRKNGTFVPSPVEPEPNEVGTCEGVNEGGTAVRTPAMDAESSLESR